MITTCKKRLLIVEDEALIQLSLSMILQSDFTEVTIVSNGKNGLREISDFPEFDLYLIDLTLPDMNGIELIKMIYELQPQPEIIVLTARYLNKESMLKKLQGIKGIERCHFLAKPFDINQVQETVFQILQKK